MQLDYIEFIFENCEHITIEGKYVCDFDIQNIQKEISRHACNDISEMEWIEHFAIEISNAGNEVYIPPFTTDEKQNKFDRMVKWNDIASIEFQLSDQYAETEEEKYVKQYSYFVDYDTNEDYSLGANNVNQQTYISELGNLYLVIDKKCKDNPDYIFEIYPKEEINDKEIVEYNYDMCDVVYNKWQ